MVKFAGLPVPGATITATMGDKKMVAVTDPQGLYSFADLADGVWNLQVEMLCFSTLKMEVAVAPNSPSPEWELKLLPFDEIKASAPAPAPAPAARSRQPRRLPHRRRKPPRWPIHRCSSRPRAAAPKKGSKGAKAAAATAAAANAQPGFQRADVNASGGPSAAGGRNPRPAASMKPPRAPTTLCW